MNYLTPLLVAAFFAAPLQFLAQDDDNVTSAEARKKVILGFKAGVTRSNVWDESGSAFVANPKAGFVGGVYLAVPFGSLLGLQPEVLVQQKGFQGRGMIAGEEYLITRTTTHLDIPVQLQFKPFKWLSVVGGPQYSYLLRQTDRFTFGRNSDEQSRAFDNDNIRNNIFGAVFGIDINLNHYVVSGRSGWDITSNHGNGFSSTPRYKNFWLSATVGYRMY